MKNLMDKLLLSPLIFSCVYADNSFLIRQTKCTRPDLILSFGPVDVSLGELFSKGWYIQGEGWLKTNCVTMRLRHNYRRDAYKLYKLHRYWSPPRITTSPDPEIDLCDYIKEGMQLMGKQSTHDADPFATLQSRYPVKKVKPKTMVGNTTLTEYVEHTFGGV